MNNQKALTGWLFLLIAGVGWGGSVSLTKIAAESGYHPITLVFWQLIISVVILFVWLAINRIRLPMSSRHLGFYFVAGILGTTLPDSMAYYIAPNLPAGIISIVYALVPSMTFCLAVLFRCEKFDLRRFAGVLLGFCAILFLVAPGFSLPSSGSAFWIFLLVLTGFCYAAESIFAVFFMPEKDHPMTMLTGMTVIALIVIIPIMMIESISFDIQNFLGKSEYALIASAILHVGCYASYLYLIRHTGAIFASQVAYVVTLSGVLWGILIFSESHSLWTWAALATAIAGLTLVRQHHANE